jgi:glycosyltransferase involved in cell wall biosynthesis
MKNNKIRLFIGTEYLNEGGVGRQIQYLVHHLDHTRFDLHLVIFREKDLFFIKLLNSEKVCVHMLNRKRRIGFRSWLEMVRICRLLRPDILHLFGGMANHLGGFASFFCHVPVIIFSMRSANNRTVNHVLYRFLKSRQSLMIVNSRGCKKELVAQAGYRHNEILLMHNFLDTATFHPYIPSEKLRAKQRLGFHSDTCLFACVGRIAHQKNQAAILMALKHLKDAGKLPKHFQFLFVGRAYDTRYASQIQRMHYYLGLQEVSSFLEPVEDMVSLYNALDGIIQPSIYEGLSNVVIEAQACGTPVALSCEGDNDDLIQDEITGISFSIRNKTEINGALEKLFELTRDKKRKQQITDRARSEVEKRFTLQPKIASLQEVYFHLLHERCDDLTIRKRISIDP